MEYSYQKFFQKVYLRREPQFAFHAGNETESLAWKQELRRTLREKLGLNLLAEYADEISQPEHAAVLLEDYQEDGYRRYKYAMQTLPEVYMPFYVLVPDGVDAQHPAAAMIAVPAHNANKNTVCGVAENQEEKKSSQRQKRNATEENLQSGDIWYSVPICPGLESGRSR